ncbi:MAG: hypothetical protein A3F74_13495 [Betaproteobacteria bacterium RIFCSPLOWO2_12_FULL_62_58]|nr:MAG: hypothetical protein A3F74_13495 [Betaproteobacteria bacterium RIFCSPLOWO2_12_FULL_62_58]
MPSLTDLLLRTVDGIFAVDPRQRIVFWNTGCELLFGVPSRQAIGQPCSSVVRGKNSAQQPFCGGVCCIANFAEGANIPTAFPLRAYNARGQEMRLNVSLLLVPSVRKDQRLCLHLLRHGEAIDSALALQTEVRPARPNHARKDVHHPAPVNTCGLTAQEQDILKLLAEGLAVRSISRLKNISEVTVRNHVQHIEAKLAVHSQAEAVAYAYRHELV